MTRKNKKERSKPKALSAYCNPPATAPSKEIQTPSNDINVLPTPTIQAYVVNETYQHDIEQGGQQHQQQQQQQPQQQQQQQVYRPQTNTQFPKTLPKTSLSVRHTTTTTTTESSGDLGPCSFLFNILWLLCSGGLVIATFYFVFAILFTMTIIGAPCGYQLFKLGKLALFPFGSEIYNYRREETSCVGAGCGCIFTLLANIIWLPLGCLLLTLHFLLGFLSFCSIIGIPFAYAHLKLASLAICPFGSETFICGGNTIVEERHEYVTIVNAV